MSLNHVLAGIPSLYAKNRDVDTPRLGSLVLVWEVIVKHSFIEANKHVASVESEIGTDNIPSNEATCERRSVIE